MKLLTADENRWRFSDRPRATHRPVALGPLDPRFRSALRSLALPFVLALPLLADAAPELAVQAAQEASEECSSFSQAERRDCLAENAELSRKALRQAEKKAAGTLSKWDETPRHIRQAKVELAAANKRFASYRDTQCGLAAALAGGAIGSALEMRRLACVSELNNRRTSQLNDWVSALPLR